LAGKRIRSGSQGKARILEGSKNKGSWDFNKEMDVQLIVAQRTVESSEPLTDEEFGESRAWLTHYERNEKTH
jgi:hypothetical protein